MSDNFDEDWVFNFDCAPPPKSSAMNNDVMIIPKVFYNAVVNRNKKQIYTVIKNNIKLSLQIIILVNNTLKNAFFYKLNSKFYTPIKTKWINIDNKKLSLNFNEEYELYKYMYRAQNKSNLYFLFNTINQYLTELRRAITFINNKMPANYYYNLGINVNNNIQMKQWISKFIL